jgi:hypothetical protein
MRRKTKRPPWYGGLSASRAESSDRRRALILFFPSVSGWGSIADLPTARTSRQSMLERPQLWNQTRGKKTYVHQAKPANPARKSISLSVMGIISESSGDKSRRPLPAAAIRR